MSDYVAIDCHECMTIMEDVPKGDPCPECGEYAYTEVVIEPCPLPEDQQDNCGNDDHDWGRGDHVVEVEG